MSLKQKYIEIKSLADRHKATFVAVTKHQPDDKVDALLGFGHRAYGENKVQEAQARWQSSSRLEQYPDLELHLIGGLQTNKVKVAVALFDVIQTLDREKLAVVLANEMARQNKKIPCFIQVNTGDETQKNGVHIPALQILYRFATEECGLMITGLMCVPPASEPPVKHFSLLHSLANELKLPHLSMGMSADYQQALECGATHIRIGNALFGERQN